MKAFWGYLPVIVFFIVQHFTLEFNLTNYILISMLFGLTTLVKFAEMILETNHAILKTNRILLEQIANKE